jgi:hypothetical protein
MTFDRSSVDAWLRAFLRRLQEEVADDYNDDALSGSISLLRRLLDKIEPGIPLSEEHRVYLVDQVRAIAGRYDDGDDISDDIDDLASAINRWS